MNIETIFFSATDKVELNGFSYKSNIKTKKVVISVHGMSTNCLKLRDEVIAKEINFNGIDFLTFNNRGHDLANYIKKEVNGKTVKDVAGTSFEEISESYNDILGAIECAIEMGYEEIYIMGHSLGCTKIIYTYNKMKKENNENLNKIKGIILLSLVDVPMAIRVYLRDEFPTMVTYAKNMQKEGMEKVLMPEKSFVHPISVKTFLRYAVNNEDINFAKYSDETYNFEELNNIDVPLFMRWGNYKEMILQDANDLCEILKNKIRNNNLNIGYIDGADHSYTGKEQVLAKEIREFLEVM